MTATSTTGSGDRTLVRLVLAVIAVLVLAPVFAMGLGMPMMAGMGWHDGTMAGTAPWWGLGMGLVWLVVLIAVGYVVYRAVDGDTTARADPALRELRLAHARGDLTDEEFESRRAKLVDAPPTES